MTSYGRAKRDMQRWLNEDRTAYVTTMFDLYRLPNDFPNRNAAVQAVDPVRKAEIIEAGIFTDVGERRLVPYIQVHEFEALLFCDPQIADGVLSQPPAVSRLRELEEIRHAFPTPEHINDGTETAPSKRICLLYANYRKPIFGPLVTQRTGIVELRRNCPHFNGWIAKLEALGEL